MNSKKNVIRDARTLGLPKMLLLGLQHMFAMFGATIRVPILVNSYFHGEGLSIQVTLFFAGVGTLFFHICARMKIPAFLGSSFAFLGSMGAAFAGAATVPAGHVGLIIGAILAGLVAAFITLWNTSEEFRQFWIDLWESIKEIAIAVWEALKAFFQAAWEAIKTTATTV